MPIFKELASTDFRSTTSTLNQLIDVTKQTISGTDTRKSYEVFVSGTTSSAITSSIFQTIFDQTKTLATANEVFDMTVGLYLSGSPVTGSETGADSSGKLLFPANNAMMREKVNVYKQFAQTLLGDESAVFTTPFSGATLTNIDSALFLSFKRLFMRDRIKRETFAITMYTSGALDGAAVSSTYEKTFLNGYTGSNIDKVSVSGSAIFTDTGAAATVEYSPGGQVGNIVNSVNTSEKVGLVFYDYGIIVLDMNKVFYANQHMSGTIKADVAADAPALIGTTIMGSGSFSNSNVNAKFIPDFVVSSSIDDIVNHICSTRFPNTTDTAITFQNNTTINSSLIFCRVSADEFNYSSNPSFTDAEGRIAVIDAGEEATQKTFSFITTVGLYDAGNNLLAVAKLSRPIEKNDEKDLTVRVRLDV